MQSLILTLRKLLFEYLHQNYFAEPDNNFKKKVLPCFFFENIHFYTNNQIGMCPSSFGNEGQKGLKHFLFST